MNCSPTITADEFKIIHNAVCDLDGLCQRLEEVLKPELYIRLLKARDQIRRGLKSAYEQDNQAYERKSNHYDDIKAQLDFKFSEWSMFEVDDLNERHPYEGADRLVYRNHWGDEPVEYQIIGSTWLALWTAANACIRDSGDTHHVYIEAFRQDKDNPRTLILYAGS